MASDNIFDIVGKYFRRSEFNHPDKIDNLSLLTLYRMRRMEGDRRKIIITVNEDYAETGHSAKSYHKNSGVCRAFDIVIRDSETREALPVIDQFLIAVRYDWNGVGFYPHWETPGLHVDTRPYTRRSLWWRNNAGVYKYNPYMYLKRWHLSA